MADPYRPQFWEIEKSGERAFEAWQYVAALEGDLLRQQIAADDECIALYEGNDRRTNDGQTVTNTVQSTTDGFVSDIVRQRVKVQFLTEGGKSEERERAIQMSRGVEGQLDEWGIYGELGIELCRDGCVRPSGGAVKLSLDYRGKRVLLDRIEASHLLVDERDAAMGDPQTLAYVGDCSPELLKARWPQMAEEIENAEDIGRNYFNATAQLRQSSVGTKRIRIYEVWHKPSVDVDSSDDKQWGIGPGGKKAKPDHDGWHLFMAGPSGGVPVVLIDEPWAIQEFPVPIFRPQKRMTGWSGHTLAQRLKRAQLEIDKYQDRIDGMLNLYSRVLFYINAKANVKVDTALSNDWRRAIVGDLPPGEAIHQFVPGTVPPDLLSYMKDLIQWAKEYSGKSDLTLSGQKPPGVESGVALRTLLDTENVRHTPYFRSWEQFILNIGKVLIPMWKLLATRDPNFSLSWGTDDALARQKWRDIDLDNDRFKMRVWPTSLFSSTPGAKLEQMVELFQATGLAKDEMMPMLASQFPDVGALFRHKNAFLSNIEKKLSMVVSAKEVNGSNMPHKFMNLAMACDVGRAWYNAAEAEGESPAVIAALGQWIETAEKEKAATTPEETPPAGAPTPEGPPLPGQTPLSDATPLPTSEQANL